MTISLFQTSRSFLGERRQELSWSTLGGLPHVSEGVFSLRAQLARRTSQAAQWERVCPPVHEMQETQVRSLEKEMATHSSILAWKIPWTEETGGLQSMASQSQTCMHAELAWGTERGKGLEWG